MAMDEDRRKALDKEYGEVSNLFRQLTDIRFRLLALLPIAAVAAAAWKGDQATSKTIALALSGFGLFATLGLITYNARNDQLYNELIGRAKSIERSLGLHDGMFANRPASWLSLRFPGFTWKVDHSTGIRTIYMATIALWLYGVLAPLLLWAWKANWPTPLPQWTWRLEWTAVVHVVAAFLAVAITMLGGRYIKRQNDNRENQMREQARNAVIAVLRPPQKCRNELVKQCALLSSEKEEKIRARLTFYEDLDGRSRAHYLPAGSPQYVAAHLVALLTNMPAGWVYDCATNRSGALRPAGACVSVKKWVSTATRRPDRIGTDGSTTKRKPIAYKIGALIENSGSTPTRGMRTCISFRRFGDDGPPADFQYPDGPDSLPLPAPVVGGRSEIASAPMPFVAADLAAGNLYIWGWIEYSDVYENTPRHRTEFCVRVVVVGVDEDNDELRLQFSPFGPFNGAESDCMRKPGAS
jgi:hypothetical protein